MIANPKATIISVYFGKLPYFFEFTKKTIHYNENFQWIIAGDSFPEKIEDKNILFLPFSLQNLSEGCTRVLQSQVNIQTPYKACDTKILWPEIFEEYVKSDWVGWADLDCIFGDLNYFLTEKALDQHDIVTHIVNTDKPNAAAHGPFTLLNKKIIQWYRDIENIAEKMNYHNLTLDKGSYIGLDEPYLAQIIKKNNYKVYSRYTPFEKENTTLPLIFSGRRRVPASWKNGKIVSDSVLEDYEEKFKNIHSMFLHIRPNVYVDIDNCKIITKTELKFIKKEKKEIYIDCNQADKLIRFHLPTIKFLYFKYKTPSCVFINENNLIAIDLFKILAPEIQIKLIENEHSLKEDLKLEEFLHGNQIPEHIICNMRDNLGEEYKEKYLDKKIIFDSNLINITENLTFVNINKKDIKEILSIFKYADTIISHSGDFLSYSILSKPNFSLYEIVFKKNQDNYNPIGNIFRDLFATTYIKRTFVQVLDNDIYKTFDILFNNNNNQLDNRQAIYNNRHNKNQLLEFMESIGAEASKINRFKPYKFEGLDIHPEIFYYQQLLNVYVSSYGLSFDKQKQASPISSNEFLNVYNEEGLKKWIKSDKNYNPKDPNSLEKIYKERKKYLEYYISNNTLIPTILPNNKTYINLLTINGNYAYGHLLDITLKILNLPKNINNPCFLINSNVKTDVTNLKDIISVLYPHTNISFLEIPSPNYSTKDSLYFCEELFELKQTAGAISFASESEYLAYKKIMLAAVKPIKSNHKVFLTRQAPLQRHIINAPELHDELTKNDILILDGSEPYFERIGIINKATHIAGYHGGLFADTCFCLENTKILEYATKNYVQKCFQRMYKDTKDHYIKILDTGDSVNAKIDIEEVLRFYTF